MTYLKTIASGEDRGKLHLKREDGTACGYIDLNTMDVATNEPLFKEWVLACLRVLPPIPGVLPFTVKLTGDEAEGEDGTLLHLDGQGSLCLQTGRVTSRTLSRPEFLEEVVQQLTGKDLEIAAADAAASLGRLPQASAHNVPQDWLGLRTLDRNTPGTNLGRNRNGNEHNRKLGQEGEKLTGAALNDIKDGWRFLHSIAANNSLGDIDHLGVGPSGVVVVDSKNNQSAVYDPEHDLQSVGRQRNRVREVLSRLLLADNIPVIGYASYVAAAPAILSSAGSVRSINLERLPDAIKALPQLLTVEEQDIIYNLLRLPGVLLQKWADDGCKSHVSQIAAPITLPGMPSSDHAKMQS